MEDFIFGSMDTDAQRLKHYKENHAGISHLSAREPRDPNPGQPVKLSVIVGQKIAIDDLCIIYTTDGTDPVCEPGQSVHGNMEKMHWVRANWDDLTWEYCHTYEGTIPGQPDQTAVRYRILARTAGGEQVYADYGAFYAYPVDTYAEPEWVQEAVIYHILVDRFATTPGTAWDRSKNIEDIFGGNFQGIRARLAYLADLGVNTLYLSPIFPCNNHHRYNATDYFEADPLLGTKQDFQNLVDDVHSRGMRLLLDFVPNHCSDQHPIFQEAIHQQTSPYRDWFTFSHYPETYDCFFGVASMPKINLRNPHARQYIIDAACYWLSLGVDGFRLDYALGPTPDFWADLRLATRKAKPDSWLIGEVVDSVNTQLAYAGLLDGCLDFILLEALRQTFASNAWNVEKFTSFLKAHHASFPVNYSRPSFLDNHDMDRFLWAAQGDKRALMLAAFGQFTLPGCPMIYYGTETGLSQQRGTRDNRGGFGKLEEARLPMPWDEPQDRNLIAYYKNLIAFRKREKVLGSGVWELVFAARDTFAYARKSRDSSLLCVFNLSKEEQTVNIPDPWNEIVFSTHVGLTHYQLASRIVTLAPMSAIAVRG